MKNILIINLYSSAPKYGGGMYRHFYLAKEFNKLDCKTSIISGSYSHLFSSFPSNKEDKIFWHEDIQGVDFLWTKTLKYKNSFDKRRVFRWFEFMFKLFFISKHLNLKPDFILCAPTEVFSIIPAYYLAKKFKAKLIFEVRDIWPLSLIQLGGFSKYHPFIALMSKVEKFAIKHCDLLVSNLQNYQLHVNDLKIDKKFHWISNGVSIDEHATPLQSETKNLIPKDKFLIAYTGKLGKSNAMTYFIQAANQLKQNKNIAFILVGEGEEKANLMKMCENAENVVFIPPVPKSQMLELLSLFDVLYIGLQDKALFKFGVSPNKIFDYMYSAKPILQAINTKNSVVELSECGVCVEAQNVEQIAKAIIKMQNMPKEKLALMGQNGKAYVLKHFTYDKLAKQYLDLLKELA